MRLGRYLASLTRPELEELKDNLNLTYDEEEVFYLVNKGNSREQISQKLCVAPATVGIRITSINRKIEKLKARKWKFD